MSRDRTFVIVIENSGKPVVTFSATNWLDVMNQFG